MLEGFEGSLFCVEGRSVTLHLRLCFLVSSSAFHVTITWQTRVRATTKCSFRAAKGRTQATKTSVDGPLSLDKRIIFRNACQAHQITDFTPSLS